MSRVGLLYITGAAAAALMITPASRLAAQDCVSAPLLGGRAAAGLAVARSTDESAAGASVTAGAGSALRVTGAYRATRLDNVDRLQHEGRVEGGYALSQGALSFCPVAGASYARLTTSRSASEGLVTTRELYAGSEVSHTLALPHALALTPFVEPVVVRRAASWRSTEGAWVVDERDSQTKAELLLGLSLATRHSAAIARFRPASGGRSSEVQLGVVTRLARR